MSGAWKLGVIALRRESSVGVFISSIALFGGTNRTEIERGSRGKLCRHLPKEWGPNGSATSPIEGMYVHMVMGSVLRSWKNVRIGFPLRSQVVLHRSLGRMMVPTSILRLAFKTAGEREPFGVVKQLETLNAAL
ncbi:uncharacterized protein EI90DRAFT_3011792 [Cantharellus anzutake]|uniref:uncharacterized protein n=1 Tax=Cantharellus anzutake TaxID=1750568 RepID=UPI0019031D9C|nr:uncharacterized protein EI90DRAFT_3011792 [Cantharellus anzutake]KAF8342293.1 hypothetical protein EI90DRAFT_3011792 [Cantharellus anzutake]